MRVSSAWILGQGTTSGASHDHLQSILASTATDRAGYDGKHKSAESPRHQCRNNRTAGRVIQYGFVVFRRCFRVSNPRDTALFDLYRQLIALLQNRPPTRSSRYRGWNRRRNNTHTAFLSILHSGACGK